MLQRETVSPHSLHWQSLQDLFAAAGVLDHVVIVYYVFLWLGNDPGQLLLGHHFVFIGDLLEPASEVD